MQRSAHKDRPDRGVVFPIADVRNIDGTPASTVDQILPLSFTMMAMHYRLGATMDGMLEQGVRNVAQQGCDYEMVDTSGIMDMSAMPLFDPQSYMELEDRPSARGRVLQVGRKNDIIRPLSIKSAEPVSDWLVGPMSNAIIFAPRSIRSLPIEAPLSPRRGLIHIRAIGTYFRGSNLSIQT